MDNTRVMLSNTQNQRKARQKHASVREVERERPLEVHRHVQRMLWPTKRPFLKQSGRHGPTYQVGLSLPHLPCNMHVHTPIS